MSPPETDGALPGPNLLPCRGGERSGPLPEGAREVRQDPGGEDDGGGREDDELHRPAETGNSSAACQTLPGGGHLQAQSHRGHQVDRRLHGEGQDWVPGSAPLDEECEHRAGPGHFQTAGEVPEGSSPREEQQAEVWQAEAGLPAENWPPGRLSV